MTPGWSSALIFLAVSAAVALAFIAAMRALAVRAKVPAPLKGATYESGEEPVGPAWIQFHPRYYLVALVFVLFDVEAALLFPWAAEVKSLGMGAAVAGLLFLAVLMLGWLYAVRKGALQWR